MPHLASDDFKAAVWQGKAVPGSLEHNIVQIREAVLQAKQQGADLLVFPELVLSGYDIGQTRLHALARPQFIAEIAKEHEMAVCVPYPEAGEAGKVYNSAALFDCQGNLVLNYRKTHLWGDYEAEIFVPGDELLVKNVRLRGDRSVNVGVLICYDVEFPEPSRVLKLKGADVILVPTALGVGDADHVTPFCSVPARAAENAVFVLYSNLSGKNHRMDFCGKSAIIAPDGSELMRAGQRGEALLVSQINFSAYASYKARNPYMRDRRPQLYGNIAKA